MAQQYQVNLQISAGTDFTQEFYLKNPDMTAFDLSSSSVAGTMAKHAGAINAVKTTSTAPVYKYINFTTSVVDATGGVYSLSLPKETTAKLNEGKYVYSVTWTDINGDKSEILSGLIFVDVAMSNLVAGGTLDENYP